MKNLFVLLCLVVSSTAFAADQEAQQKDINDLKCTGGVNKSMIASVAELTPVDGYPNSVGVVWEWQQFIASATESGMLAVTLGDSRFGSFKGVKSFKIQFRIYAFEDDHEIGKEKSEAISLE